MTTRPSNANAILVLMAMIQAFQRKLFYMGQSYGTQHVSFNDNRNLSSKIYRRYHTQRGYEDKCGFRRTNG